MRVFVVIILNFTIYIYVHYYIECCARHDCRHVRFRISNNKISNNNNNNITILKKNIKFLGLSDQNRNTSHYHTNYENMQYFFIKCFLYSDVF